LTEIYFRIEEFLFIHQFLDRERELDFLNRHYRSNEAEFIVLYGRIGKTELIQN